MNKNNKMRTQKDISIRANDSYLSYRYLSILYLIYLLSTIRFFKDIYLRESLQIDIDERVYIKNSLGVIS